MIKKLSQRFDELEAEGRKIDDTKEQVDGLYGMIDTIDSELFTAWKVKVKNLLSIACGESSQHFQVFIEDEKVQAMDSSYSIFKRLRSIFSAAKEDFNGGYITSVKNIVQAEVFESELEQAQELLDNGYKLASAVIAGVVLETALRELCSKHNISHGKLDRMNSELAKSGVYSKLQQKRITALADIRNSAAHGKPNEFSEDDVKTMIRDVESFLLASMA